MSKFHCIDTKEVRFTLQRDEKELLPAISELLLVFITESV